MSFEPMGDRVLVRPTVTGDRTEGGLYIPENARQDAFSVVEGTVVAVGEGRSTGTGRLPISLLPGDRVFYCPMGPIEVTVEGQRMHLVREDDVYGRDRTG